MADRRKKSPRAKKSAAARRRGAKRTGSRGLFLTNFLPGAFARPSSRPRDLSGLAWIQFRALRWAGV